tara:strand:+ start:5940 stop:6134 length:195 start_codon:yes stop_codon:yes gene_type:complete
MSKLPDGYSEINKKPSDLQEVLTVTLWCGSWIFGSALYKNGQYWSGDGKTMLDTPSGWASKKAT